MLTCCASDLPPRDGTEGEGLSPLDGEPPPLRDGAEVVCGSMSEADTFEKRLSSGSEVALTLFSLRLWAGGSRGASSCATSGSASASSYVITGSSSSARGSSPVSHSGILGAPSRSTSIYRRAPLFLLRSSLMLERNRLTHSAPWLSSLVAARICS